jgi:diguanylate cyclase (GGDEF)-like protein
MSQGICVFDAHERLVLCNDRFRDMHSFAERQVTVGTTYDTIIELICEAPGRSAQETAALMTKARQRHLDSLARPHETVVFEVMVHGRVLEVNRRALPDGGWVSTTDDVTERRHAQEHIHHLAHHDALTDLLNRSAFRKRLDAALRGRDAGAPLALLYVDLDRFKPINDTWGHPVGDAVLKVVARRISAQLRPVDALCRLGGDEFTVMLDDCAGPQAALAAQRLIDAIGEPISVHGINVSVGASVGLAFAPADGGDPDTLLRNADLALQCAKGSGRNCQKSYEAGMELTIQRRAAMERDLRTALAGGELSLHYQPIACSSLRRIEGFEALLRWRSPTRGTVSPAEFIPFAEEIGLMAEIDDWVLNRACAEAATWPPQLKLSVNLSAPSLKLPDLPARVAAVLARTGLPQDRLEVEVTETAMIDDVAQTAKVLSALRDLGVGVALDDFGTGYSSLSFLLSLPFTRIKVDRSFIRDLGRRPEAGAIVRAVVGLCRTLGVAMTAEGLETPEQLDELRAEQCPAVQGYLVGRPSSPAEIIERIRNAMPPLENASLVA